jgi:hypothetical protein
VRAARQLHPRTLNYLVERVLEEAFLRFSVGVRPYQAHDTLPQLQFISFLEKRVHAEL